MPEIPRDEPSSRASDTVDPRIAVLSDLSSPEWSPVSESYGMPWDDAVAILDRYRAAVLKEAAEKVRTEGPAVIASWFNYHAPDGSQPSHSERVNGAAEAVGKLIDMGSDARG